MKIIQKTALIMTIIIGLNACTKQGDTGATGPQGVQGIKGDSGTNGTNGKNGTNGSNGTNGQNGTNGTNGVSGLTITSYTVTAGQWSLNSGDLVYSTSVSIPTTDVCMVYLSTDNSGFVAIPLTSAFVNNDEFVFGYKTGTDVVLSYYNPANTTNPSIPETLYFNIVKIPPAGLNAHPNTNWHNYSEVKAIIQQQNDKQ